MKKLNFLKSLLLVFFVVSSINGLQAQTLTLSSSGETGVSGTNWTSSGTNPVKIIFTGTASVNTSVIVGYLNGGKDVIIEPGTGGSDIILSNDISASGTAKFILNSPGTIYINANVSTAGPQIYNGITNFTGARNLSGTKLWFNGGMTSTGNITLQGGNNGVVVIMDSVHTTGSFSVTASSGLLSSFVMGVDLVSGVGANIVADNGITIVAATSYLAGDLKTNSQSINITGNVQLAKFAVSDPIIPFYFNPDNGTLTIQDSSITSFAGSVLDYAVLVANKVKNVTGSQVNINGFNSGGTNYLVYQFTTPGADMFYTPFRISSADYLVVAGGGGGGGSYQGAYAGGGAGGGGVANGTLSLSPSLRLDLTVGAGGVAGTNSSNAASQSDGGNGGDSRLTDTILTGGGGGGGAAGDGGTAGKVGQDGTGGVGYTAGGGGGGAGGAGGPINGGAGGIGTQRNGGSGSQDSQLTNFGGAGGGADNSNATQGTWANGPGIGGAGVTSSITGASVEYGRGAGSNGTTPTNMGNTPGSGSVANGYNNDNPARVSNGYDGAVILRVTVPGTLNYFDNNGLSLGTATNTGDVLIRSNINIGGRVFVYGASITLDSSLKTVSTINLHATGTVTQSAAITAKGLGLHETGTFTLNNTANHVDSIAGGNNTTKLGSLSYTQSGDLHISHVNPTGIYSTGPVSIATDTGNIYIEQPISTESTSSDAVIINAGKGKLYTDTTGGNIQVFGSPTVTAGAGAIIKLFSGSKEGSTGLGTVAQGERFLVDENILFSPVLSPDSSYALYRGAKITSTAIADFSNINAPSGVYSDTVWLRARLVDAETNKPISGETIRFVIHNGSNLLIKTPDFVDAVTDDKGYAKGYIKVTQDPDGSDDFEDRNGDSLHISALYNGNPLEGYAATATKVNFNVRKETAHFMELGIDPSNPAPGLVEANKIKFNGKLGSGYIETSNNSVDVTVTVKIQEEEDGSLGDITKARVRFELNPSGTNTPLVLDQNPDEYGNVSVTFGSVPVGSYGSNSFSVHVTAGDYYKARLNSTLTIRKKGVESLFSGGGDIQIGTSTGKYAADPGTVTCLSVGSKYNKTASKVQGKASLIFISKGRTYEVTGNGTPTVIFDSVGGVASYVSAASISETILDSISGTVVTTPIATSGLTLSYNLKDSTNDFVSVKVAEPSIVYYTNQGSGSTADRQVLIRGGMTVALGIAAPVSTPVTRCGSGSVTLTATPPSGATVDWYDASTGGTKLLAGSASFTFTTTSNVTYYAESRNTATNSLSLTRTPASVTINAQPDAPNATGGARCGSGSVVLSSTLSANTTIAWYSAATGGKALGTSSAYTTPSISTTTNYYAESKSTVNGCLSATRAVATATINALPTAPVTTSAATCGPGTVTLGANTNQSGKQIEWYAASKGGASFNVGTTYTIPNLTATTTFYTLSKDMVTGCSSSSRTAVTATLSSNPAAPSSITGTVSSCPTSTTALTFTAAKVTGASSYQWSKPSCATGTSLTNSISLTFSVASASDVVSVQAVNTYGCQSASKSVLVTTNTTCTSCGTLVAGSINSLSGESVVAEHGIGAAQIGVYPNPNNGQFNLWLKGFDAGSAVVRILDMNGSVVYLRQYNLLSGPNILPMKISKSVQGVYMIQVMQSGKIKAIKMLKE